MSCTYPSTGQVETGRPQGLANQANGELQVEWETLSQKIRQTAIEGDIQYQPLTKMPIDWLERML